VQPNQPIPESGSVEDYLESSQIIDWHTPAVASLAWALAAGLDSDVDKAKRLYEWVRDEIPHSADAGHETVTCRASDVLRQRTGICYPKAHLLAAMLRSVDIPAGLCYQLLRYDESSERLVVHGLNGIYLKSIGRWIRVDPRGNKSGVDAQFRLDHEQLAFPVNPALGERTCATVFVRPLPNTLRCLAGFGTVAEVMLNLPSTIDNGHPFWWGRRDDCKSWAPRLRGPIEAGGYRGQGWASETLTLRRTRQARRLPYELGVHPAGGYGTIWSSPSH
jgi:hypothetical protein